MYKQPRTLTIIPRLQKLALLTFLLFCIPAMLFALSADEIIQEMDRLATFETTYSTGSIQTTDASGQRPASSSLGAKGRKIP